MDLLNKIFSIDNDFPKKIATTNSLVDFTALGIFKIFIGNITIYPYIPSNLTYLTNRQSNRPFPLRDKRRQGRGEARKRERERRRLKSSSAGKGDADAVKGRRNESGAAKKHKKETKRGRIPADSGARYRVTFVMVSAETSTSSRRYTPVAKLFNRPSTRWNESTTNLIFLTSRTWFPPRDSRPIVFRLKVWNKFVYELEQWNIYVTDSLYSWNTTLETNFWNFKSWF